MKHFGKYLLLAVCMTASMVLFCACGNSKSESTESKSESSTDMSSEKDTESTSDGNDGGIIDEAVDAVKDVADGVTDAAEDVVSGAFKSFDDAKDWFMDQLPSGDGRFEVANSDTDLAEYSDGKKGYHIELHDNELEGDTKAGDFYIDADSGKVYKSDEHGKTFAEYDFSDYK